MIEAENCIMLKEEYQYLEAGYKYITSSDWKVSIDRPFIQEALITEGVELKSWINKTGFTFNNIVEGNNIRN